MRKLIEHEPSSIELLQQNNEPKYKKRKNSSSDASSKLGGGGKKVKKQPIVGPPVIPKLPIVIDKSSITLMSLGKIVERPAFHTETCIYPVGYKISRVYNNKVFICRIIDNGEGPLFEAFLAIDPKNSSFQGPTTDDCHAEILQAFDNFNMPYVLDGDQFFGLTNNKIKEYINMLPNARRIMKIKQEIKQESLAFDDNARNYLMTPHM